MARRKRVVPMHFNPFNKIQGLVKVKMLWYIHTGPERALPDNLLKQKGLQ